ncbi:monovalent cation/H+ antiporter complex subunit F [Thermophagus xiamenensis]|uniref:Multisubunit sodium/proton antiporter, MrpF subunit n=1 Tax=Thermophagus xiamenensis TaxID=385682 RepID=A0A1I2BS35_9BACT|nr:monovalent cation/H+ antiporter complex subunit F [Thermophagus xiamenensis]SFE58133.1 multisubunit sodium/proton antiporter, MrpF subunit [Thermophagus xiamenensis]
MENSTDFLTLMTIVALYLFSISILFPLYRLFKGPSLSDRVVALDQIGVIVVGMMVCDVFLTREKLLLDVVLIVSFILVFSSMIISRYLLKQNKK